MTMSKRSREKANTNTQFESEQKLMRQFLPKSKFWRNCFKYLPFFIQTIYIKAKKKRAIKKRYKELYAEIVNNLATHKHKNVQEQLGELSDLEEVLSLQNKLPSTLSYLGICLLVCTSILVGIPGCSSPGFVDVSTKHADFVLAADYEWTGITNIDTQKAILLSNFEHIYSPNIAELSIEQPDEIVSVKASQEATLESISIPANTRVKVDWDEKERTISFEFLPSNAASSQNMQVRAEYLLYGDTSFESEPIEGPTLKSRPAIPCDDGENCFESRSLVVSSAINFKPRITFSLKDELDLYGIEIEHFLFSKYTIQNSQRQRKRCMILEGEYWLRGAEQPATLRRGECTRVTSSGGALNIQVSALPSEKTGLEVWYQGQIETIYVGTPELAIDKTPQIYTWLMYHPNIKIVISFISALLAVGLVIVRIRK